MRLKDTNALNTLVLREQEHFGSRGSSSSEFKTVEPARKRPTAVCCDDDVAC